MRQEERMSWHNSVMFIARIARVRCLVIGAVKELVIFNEHMIGKWFVGEIGKDVTVGDKEELADVMTRSRVWECRWVGNKTCWVKFAWSRSNKNCMALESVRSSTWMLKSPVIRNSWEVDTDKMRVWKSSKNWEKNTECRDFILDWGGR